MNGCPNLRLNKGDWTFHLQVGVADIFQEWISDMIRFFVCVFCFVLLVFCGKGTLNSLSGRNIIGNDWETSEGVLLGLQEMHRD